jgi:hypothetical protein
VLGIHETVMLIMLLVVGIGYLVDRLAADAPDHGGRERERKRRGESS